MGNKFISILKKWDLRSMGLGNMGKFFFHINGISRYGKYGKVIVQIYINYGLCIYLYILYLIWDMGKLYKITIDNYGLVPLCA
jgi:hypothetical protein